MRRAEHSYKFGRALIVWMIAKSFGAAFCKTVFNIIGNGTQQFTAHTDYCQWIT